MEKQRVLVAEDYEDVRTLYEECLERAGFHVEALYGWFDRRPYADGEDTVWICTRPA